MLLFFWRYIIPDVRFNHYTEKPPYYQCEKVIDNATSVIWCERYQEPGEISLLLPATQELMKFFWEPGLIVTRTDSDRAMRVENVTITTASDGVDQIRITGRSAESFPAERVIMQRGRLYQKPVDAVNYLIRENIGAYWYEHTDKDHQHDSLDVIRYFNLFAEGESNIEGAQEITDDAFGENLGSVITEYCRGHDFGFKVVFDGEKLLYSCYRGSDRTLNQSDRNAVVFADDFRNLGASEYTRNRNEYYSHVIVGGAGAGLERAWSDFYKDYRAYRGIGGNMREKFINASGVESDTLSGVAFNAVTASRETYSMTAEAESGGQYRYREHYFLGDRVSVVNRYGLEGTATVSEVVETEDENGSYCIPTLTAFDTSEYIAPVRPEKPELYQGITIYPKNADPLYYDNFQDAYDYLRANSSLLCDITIGRMFETIPGNAFPNWANINSIVMYNGVINIEDRAFYSIGSLKSVTIPASVRKIGVSAFYRCRKMKTLTIPGNVETFGDSAFNACEDLEAVVIQNGVISIPARCFQYCSSLSSITIPASVETIGDYAFYYCQSLLTITIPKPQGSISGAPWGAPNATVIWTG